MLFCYTINDYELSNLPNLKIFFQYVKRLNCWTCLDIHCSDITKIETMLLYLGSKSSTNDAKSNPEFHCVILIREGLNVLVPPSVLSQSLRLYISKVNTFPTYLNMTLNSLDRSILSLSSLPSEFKKIILTLILLYIPVIYRCNLQLFTYSYPLPPIILHTTILELYNLLKDEKAIYEFNDLNILYKLLFENYIYQSLLCEEGDKYYITELYNKWKPNNWIETINYYYKSKSSNMYRNMKNLSVESICDYISNSTISLSFMVESIHGINSVNYYISMFYGEWNKNFSILYTNNHATYNITHNTISKNQLEYLVSILKKIPVIQSPEELYMSHALRKVDMYKLILYRSNLPPTDKVLTYEIIYKNKLTSSIIEHHNKFINHFSQGHILSENDKVYFYYNI